MILSVATGNQWNHILCNFVDSFPWFPVATDRIFRLSLKMDRALMDRGLKEYQVTRFLCLHFRVQHVLSVFCVKLGVCCALLFSHECRAQPWVLQRGSRLWVQTMCCRAFIGVILTLERKQQSNKCVEMSETHENDYVWCCYCSEKNMVSSMTRAICH